MGNALDDMTESWRKTTPAERWLIVGVLAIPVLVGIAAIAHWFEHLTGKSG